MVPALKELKVQQTPGPASVRAVIKVQTKNQWRMKESGRREDAQKSVYHKNVKKP